MITDESFSEIICIHGVLLHDHQDILACMCWYHTWELSNMFISIFDIFNFTWSVCFIHAWKVWTLWAIWHMRVTHVSYVDITGWNRIWKKSRRISGACWVTYVENTIIKEARMVELARSENVCSKCICICCKVAWGVKIFRFDLCCSERVLQTYNGAQGDVK